MALADFVGRVKSLSPASATLLLRGFPETLDSYGRTRTITGGTAGIGLVPRRSKKGWWLGQGASVTAGGGSISIADAAELRATSGTIFWTARRFSVLAAENGHRVVSKRDAGGTTFDIYFTGVANQLGFYDGTSFVFMSSALLAGARVVAIRYASGGIPQLFVDGTYRADGSSAVTPPSDDAPLYLGNMFVGAQGSRVNDYGFFAIFNDAILGRAITDQEIRELHDAWMSIDTVFEPKRRIYLPRKATDIVATAPLLHWAGERNAQGLLLDLSGNGRNGTISGRVTQTKTPEGTCQVGHGAGDPLIISASDAALNPANITIELRVKRNGRGQSNSGVWFAVNNNLTACLELFDNGAAGLAIGENYADGEAYWTFAVPTVALKAVVHIVIKYNRDTPGTLPVVFVDGELVTVTNTVAKTGARAANAAPRVSVLNRGAVDLDADGCHIQTKVYASLLTDAECRALYLDHALSGAQRLANRTDYPVSVAAVAAGGMAGPHRVKTGTHKWQDDGTRRQLACVTAGTTTVGAAQAYGAWYFRAKKALDGNTQIIEWSALSNSGGTGDNGWRLYLYNDESIQLWRLTNGAAAGAGIVATAVGYIAVGVEYEFLLTRRARDGYFTLWIRGGAYATWTAVGTGTDNTYTTISFINTNFGVGDTLADVRFFSNGGTLLPTEVPDLAA